MKRFASKLMRVVDSIVCDRCSAEARPEDRAFSAFLSLGGGKGEVDDGSRLAAKIDLCHQCQIELLGPWLQAPEPQPTSGHTTDRELHDERCHVEQTAKPWPNQAADTISFRHPKAEGGPLSNFHDAHEVVGPPRYARVEVMERAHAMGLFSDLPDRFGK